MNKLYPFKWFVLQNFPFIEEDFDAITNYQLLCKVVEYLNKTIDKTNELGIEVEALNNWFNNLDVQNEIDNKLDEMAESGELTEIIAQYLELAGLLCFNTVNDMKNADNLTNGSFTKTLGNDTYDDGYGNFYKIRTLLNTDVVDEENIISLTNYPTLIAELIPNNYIRDIEERFDDVVLMMSDSYADNVNNTVNWCDLLKAKLKLKDNNYIKIAKGGLGFVGTDPDGKTFLTYLQEHLPIESQRVRVKKLILCGGYNDVNSSYSDIVTAIGNFVTYVNTTFPNATIYLGMIGNNSALTESATNARNNLALNVMPAYKRIINMGGIYLTGVETILKNYLLMNLSDNFHPNDDGEYALASGIYQALINGNGNINIYDESYILDSETLAHITDDKIIKLRHSGGMTTIDFPILGYTFPTTRTPINGVDFELFMFNSNCIRNVYKFFMPINATIDGSTNLAGFLYLNDTNKLCARFTVDTPASISSITIFPMTYNLPTINC